MVGVNITAALQGATVALTSTLTDTVTVAHRTDASDGAGGTTVTYGTDATIPARVHMDATASPNAPGTERVLSTWTIVSTTPDGIHEGDRVRWVDTDGTERTMFVVHVSDSSWALGRYATAVEAP